MAQPHMAGAQVVQQPTQTYLRDPRQTTITQKDHEILIRYIIDYCDKKGFKDTSTHLRRESKINDNQKPPVDSPEGLLYEWWTCFWQIYTARVHPEKSTNNIAKAYAQKLPQIQMRASHDQGQMGPGPTARSMGGPPRPYINGTGPHPQTVVNGHGSSFPNPVPGMNGAPPPTANMPGVSGVNPTPLQNPNLQHLGPPRPGQTRPLPGPGIPGMPPAQFAYQAGGRMPPNVGPYPPNTRPGPGGQSGSPQMADSQMGRASSSPQQSSSTSLADIHPQQLQEHLRDLGYTSTNDVHSLPEEVKARIRDLHDQRQARTRGTKRPSPGGEESLPKGESPSDRKKQRRSPQEPGATLPSTPSMTPAQPPIGARPQPSNIGQPKMSSHPHVLYPHPMGGPPGSFGAMNSDALQGPEFAGQMAHLLQAQAQTQRLQTAPSSASQQSNQQYFTSIQQQTVMGYKPSPTNGMMPPSNSNSSQPLIADPQFGRQLGGATGAPKRAMLPPPPPHNPSIPSPVPGGQMPLSKGTPIMSGAVPRGLPGSKDDSSPSGIDAFSPENNRPASRPIPGSTPQAIASAPTPTASAPGPAPIPGAPSAMSIPSPSQLATPQQSSRPQSQSPSSTAIARPSTATLNGTPTPNPATMLSRPYPGAPSGPGSMLGGGPGNHTLNSGHLGGAPGPSNGMESHSNDLFGMGLGMPFAQFDMQMMNFQEDAFPPFDLSLGLSGGEEFSMYINDPGDSVSG